MTTFASIIDKLKAANSFPGYPNYIRHTNGDTLDNRPENLEIVHFRDALANIDNWKVDYVCEITEEEFAFLKNMFQRQRELAEATEIVRAEQESYIAGTTTAERQAEIHAEFPNALADWDVMRLARENGKPSQEQWYIEQLLSQGQDNLNICPSCFKDGNRNPNCTNAVVVKIDGKHRLVCCALGSREE